MLEAKAGWPAEVRKPLLTRGVSIQVVQDAIMSYEKLCDRVGPEPFRRLLVTSTGV